MEQEGLSGKQLPVPSLPHQEQLKLPVETKKPQVCEKDRCADAVVAYFEETLPQNCFIPGEILFHSW